MAQIQPYGFCHHCNKCDVGESKPQHLEDYKEDSVETITKLMLCGRCHVAQYCDKQCQERDWAKHKTQCLPSDFVVSRMVLNKTIRSIFHKEVLPTAGYNCKFLSEYCYISLVISSKADGNSNNTTEFETDSEGNYKFLDSKIFNHVKRELPNRLETPGIPKLRRTYIQQLAQLFADYPDKFVVEIHCRNAKPVNDEARGATVTPLGNYMFRLCRDNVLKDLCLYPFGPTFRQLDARWQEKDQDGFSPQNEMSLNQFIFKQIDMQPEIVQGLLAHQTHYFTPEEVQTLEACITKGKIRLKYPYLSEWVKLRGDGYKEPYHIYLKNRDQLGGDYKGVCEDKNLLKPGEVHIFVVTTNKKFYIIKKIRGESTHSSLSEGRPVLACGELTVDNEGSIVKLTNWSGHYNASYESPNWGGAHIMVAILHYLRDNEVDISLIPHISLEWYNEDVRLPSVPLTGISCQPIKEWLKDRARLDRLLKMYRNLRRRMDDGAALVETQMLELKQKYPYDTAMENNIVYAIKTMKDLPKSMFLR